MPLSKNFTRRSLDLTDEQWMALEQLAEALGSTATTGSNVGQPSWRTLIREIANRTIALSRKDTTDATDTI